MQCKCSFSRTKWSYSFRSWMLKTVASIAVIFALPRAVPWDRCTRTYFLFSYALLCELHFGFQLQTCSFKKSAGNFARTTNFHLVFGVDPQRLNYTFTLRITMHNLYLHNQSTWLLRKVGLVRSVNNNNKIFGFLVGSDSIALIDK